MTQASTQARRAQTEAAAWYARLSARVSNQTLAEFFDWRSDAVNDAAYTRVEALTTTARALADDPRLQALANEAVSRPPEAPARPRRSRAGLLAGVAAGLLVSGAAVVAAVVVRPWDGRSYGSAVGERRAIALADGSIVELNTDSRVRVRLGKTERRLTLERGQAMFSVAHDPARPFVVSAGGATVRALGTRFAVYRTGEAVRVTLAEGRVEVAAPKAWKTPVTLNAGQEVEAGGVAAQGRPHPVDVAAATAWRQGRLTFHDTRLADAVAEVNRYSRRQVRLGSGAPADLRVNGAFDAGDTNAFVQGVTTLLDLRAQGRPNGDVELIAPSPSS
jgi:transmembrane sensor